MITPEFLEELDYSELVMLFSELNIELTQEIIEQIQNGKNISEMSKSEFNKFVKGISAIILASALLKASKLNSSVKKELKNTYTNMAKDNMKSYEKLFEYRGLKYEVSDDQLKILNRAIEKSSTEIANFTKTIAFSSQKAYVEAIDKAYLDILSGKNYIKVIDDTVRDLAEKGITLEYKRKNGKSVQVQLETAVRRNVLSGIKETASDINKVIEKKLGCNGYTVPAHSGARPSHAEAQGKQYAITRSNAKKYNVGFWGDVKHLWNEYNCRHTPTGIILGISEPLYTDEELEELKNSKVTYKGKKIPEYEATQIQRRLEREQRNLKRQLQPLKNSQNNIKDEELKREQEKTIKELQLRLSKKRTEYKQFCNETGLTPQYERTKVI